MIHFYGNNMHTLSSMRINNDDAISNLKDGGKRKNPKREKKIIIQLAALPGVARGQ